MPVSPLATQTTLKRVRIWSSWASSPSELAISTRRLAVTAADLHLGDGIAGGPGRLVRPGQQLELATLVHRVGRRATARAVVRRRPECHRAHPGVPLAGHRGGRTGGGQQPGFAQVGRVGETGRVAVDDADPRAARPP